MSVADAFTVNVNLGGLVVNDPSDALTALGGTVEIPAALSVDPLSLAPGVIADAVDLFPFEVLPSGNVDAEFFQGFGLPISSNGLFFSFDVTADSAGTGIIGFEAFSPFAQDADFFVDVETNSLAFTVTSGAGAVPEPHSITALALISMIGIGSIRRKNQCAVRAS